MGNKREKYRSCFGERNRKREREKKIENVREKNDGWEKKVSNRSSRSLFLSFSLVSFFSKSLLYFFGRQAKLCSWQERIGKRMAVMDQLN